MEDSNCFFLLVRQCRSAAQHVKQHVNSNLLKWQPDKFHTSSHGWSAPEMNLLVGFGLSGEELSSLRVVFSWTHIATSGDTSVSPKHPCLEHPSIHHHLNCCNHLSTPTILQPFFAALTLWFRSVKKDSWTRKCQEEDYRLCLAAVKAC